MTVSVEGTTISSAVDQDNRFTLRGVPAGSPRLRFSSASVNATLSLTDVEVTETIGLAVSVTPTSAVIESVSRSTGSAVQLEGRIESMPALPAGSLVVGDRVVNTDADTRVLQGSTVLTFASLVVGQRVHVKGSLAGSALLASVIDIQNTNVDIPVPINGTIANFTGSAGAFEFQIDGRLIKGDSLTEFFGGSEFSDIANGRRAEVKGSLREAYVYATRVRVEVEEDEDDDEEEGDESASIEGPLESKGGTAPLLTLVVDGTTVTTTAATVVRRRGDVQDFGALALGMTLHVVGDRQANSSIIARMIQIKDDAVGSLFEIEGSMGGVNGTCAALAFGINGYSIVTNAATAFTPACTTAVFKSGTKVRVKGVVQAGGGVLATSVEKE